MKVIFLDIDGVLNYDLWYINRTKYIDQDIDPKCVSRINRLCELTDAKIVISSDWRYDAFYKFRLERAGLKNIIDATPIFDLCAYQKPYDPTRGDEINYWLECHPDVTDYCIIDDIVDFSVKQRSKLVKTNYYYGFTDEDFKKALKILNG